MEMHINFLFVFLLFQFLFCWSDALYVTVCNVYPSSSSIGVVVVDAAGNSVTTNATSTGLRYPQCALANTMWTTGTKLSVTAYNASSPSVLLVSVVLSSGLAASDHDNIIWIYNNGQTNNSWSVSFSPGPVLAPCAGRQWEAAFALPPSSYDFYAQVPLLGQYKVKSGIPSFVPSYIDMTPPPPPLTTTISFKDSSNNALVAATQTKTPTGATDTTYINAGTWTVLVGDGRSSSSSYPPTIIIIDRVTNSWTVTPISLTGNAVGSTPSPSFDSSTCNTNTNTPSPSAAYNNFNVARTYITIILLCFIMLAILFNL